MNEDDFARRIADRLDRELGRLPPDIAQGLAHARKRALEQRQKLRLPERVRAWCNDRRGTFGVALPAMIIVVTAATILYLNTPFEAAPLDIETAILSDELPIRAYTDPGFDAWLLQTSYDQQ